MVERIGETRQEQQLFVAHYFLVKLIDTFENSNSEEEIKQKRDEIDQNDSYVDYRLYNFLHLFLQLCLFF